ncbi:MAG: type II toxin-antitoxin system VapC family toxin [Reyranella sp.]|nr:type II toxin-antitoxin system VapC family toxin [Reyranella sp.]
MYVDASAIVAILNREPEADAFADAIERSTAPVTSPIAVFEATLGLCRIRHATVEEAAADVAEFMSVAAIQCLPIATEEADTALLAAARYGKGRGHPAQLNLGDCFAYAMARNRRIPLLFKGDDFTKTDIDSAT